MSSVSGSSGSSDKSKTHSTNNSPEEKKVEKKVDNPPSNQTQNQNQGQNQVKGFPSDSSFKADGGKPPVEINAAAPVTQAQAPVNQEALDAAYDAVVSNVTAAINRKPPAEPAGAAEVMQGAVTAALETLKQQYPNMPPQEMMDYAMAAAGAALVGPDWADELRTVGGDTRVVQLMEALPKDAFMGEDLAASKDLNPAFDDTTANQVFHCGFFMLAGYASQGDPLKATIARGANFKHELFDDGASVADFIASEASIQLGIGLYRMGQSNDWNTVKQAPALMQGMLGNGEPAPYQIAGETVDATQLSQNARRYTEEIIDKMRAQPATGMVSVVEAFQDFATPAVTKLLTPIANWWFKG